MQPRLVISNVNKKCLLNKSNCMIHILERYFTEKKRKKTTKQQKKSKKKDKIHQNIIQIYKNLRKKVDS